jgi:hypothetical protein
MQYLWGVVAYDQISEGSPFHLLLLVFQFANSLGHWRLHDGFHRDCYSTRYNAQNVLYALIGVCWSTRSRKNANRSTDQTTLLWQNLRGRWKGWRFLERVASN